MALTRKTRLSHGTKRLQRRAPLRSRSRKASRERRKAQPVVDAAFERDGYQCVLRHHKYLAGDCMGQNTPHHLRKQSAERGGWTDDNLVTLCWHHNCVWVEGNSDEAHALGLVVRNGETTFDAWSRMIDEGLPVEQPGWFNDELIRRAGFPATWTASQLTARLRGCAPSAVTVEVDGMADRCVWPTGTAWSGPKTCGRPVKAYVRATRRIWDDWPVGHTGPVCGIHRNVALRFPDKTDPAFELDEGDDE